MSQCSNGTLLPTTDTWRITTIKRIYINNSTSILFLNRYAMVESLPQENVEWVEELDSKFWDVAEDSDVGYFLEVDLEYPKDLQDEHKDPPFCPELLHKATPGSKQAKLMTTLYDKERYVVYYRVLQQALEHGLILRKVHRALKFKQSPWLKSYIDYNSRKRAESKN